MPSLLRQKLQMKPGQSLLLINAPQSFQEIFNDGSVDVLPAVQIPIQCEVVMIFFNNLAEAQQFSPEVMRALLPGGLLWMAYPKGGSGVKTDINRDRLWEMIEPTGWRPVRQIALDDVWTAMRFKPAV